MYIPLTAQQIEQVTKRFGNPLLLKSEDSFTIIGKTSPEGITFQAYDEFKERYELFEMDNPPTQLALQLQEFVRLQIQEVLVGLPLAVEEMLQWMEETFQVQREHPFQKTPTASTFKTVQKQKWFALVMEVPWSVLQEEALGTVWIANVKVSPENREQWVDFKQIFPAYHMNKKHWVSIALSESLEKEKFYTLVRESYRLVEA